MVPNKRLRNNGPLGDSRLNESIEEIERAPRNSDEPRQRFSRLILTAAAVCILLSVNTRPQQTVIAQQSSPAQTAPPVQPDPDTLRRDEVTSILRESRRIVSEHGVEESINVPIGGIR